MKPLKPIRRPARLRHRRQRHVGRAAPQRRRRSRAAPAGHRDHWIADAHARPRARRHARRRRRQSHQRSARSSSAIPTSTSSCELIGGIEPARDARARGDRATASTSSPPTRRCSRTHGNEIFAAAQQEGRDGGVRGGGRRRHPDHQGAARGPDRQPHRMDRRHHQRHLATSSCRRCATTGCGFADVLAEAQARGYAEADPTFDIEGIDAAHKLTIMSAIAFGIPMQFEQGLHRRHLEAHAARTSATPRSSATASSCSASRGARAKRHRAARASDADSARSG